MGDTPAHCSRGIGYVRRFMNVAEIVLLGAGAGGGFARNGLSGVEAGGGKAERGLHGQRLGRETQRK
ncbi:hypothetical protein E2C01_060083 [Portunus trituberculatus]|uniref:Uncharacterized protein n=1 Tax=Portunus trituberculatus TaxID=210409 RepID=A0A5B7H8C1_PORTR|nr:hypothetical protein [Portunus trituberculatus]